MDISPGHDFAVLAGRDILKTIRVSDSSCLEDVNLRSEILNHATTHNPLGSPIPAKHKDQLAANDVKWSHGQFDTTIATAVANGQIAIYDINRAGVESARLHEHNRQVHRLAFNPYNPAYLISGSQDATVRLWDLRALDGQRSVMNFGSASSYSLNNEGIRDIKWSPRDAVEFAAGTDNGVVQRWDFRKQTSPLLKINAHEKTCHTIDWHPDGKHLASGGADKNVKVWDFSSTDRRMKVCWQIRTPQAIRQVRWRPSCAKTDSHSSTHVPCTQLATAYDHQDPRIHVWDFRRPFIPFREIEQYETSATAMLWHSEDLLWSVGSEGIFIQTDLNHTSKVIDKKSSNVLSIASGGRLSFFSEQRAGRRRPSDDMPSDFPQNRHEAESSGDRLSGSHSVTDGSFEESSLLSSSFKSRQLRPPTSRSAKSIGTPPYAIEGEYILKLDEALQREYIYRPAQSAASGTVAGIFDAEAFSFLARKYQLIPTRPTLPDSWDPHIVLPQIFDENASLAGSVGQHRLAQSWRILGLALGKELKSRAEIVRAARLRFPVLSHDVDQVGYEYRRNEIRITEPAVPVTDESSPARRVQKGLPSVIDNGSNVTTPLARPISLSNGERQRHVAVLHDDESFHLPDAAFTKQSRIGHLQKSSDLTRMKNTMEITQSDPVTDRPLTAQVIEQPPRTDGYTAPTAGFLDLDISMDERRAAITNYRAQPRPLLRLDDPFQLPRDCLAPSLGRHDSDESFQLFSASTDGSQPTPSISGSYGSSRESRKSDSSPERKKLGGRHGSGEHSKGWQYTNNSLQGVQSPQDLGDNLAPKDLTEGLVQALQGPSHAVILTTLRPGNPNPPQIHVDDFTETGDHGATTSDGVTNSQPHFIPSDFIPVDEPVPSKPWTATAMLRPLIDYHINILSDKQMPAFLIQYLAPYLSLSISPTLMAAILLDYHDQLTSLSLYGQAAHLRKANENLHLEIADHGTYGITPGGPWCTVCQKLSKGDRSNFCERCMNNWDPCPICNGEGHLEPLIERKPPQTVAKGNTLWGWCPGCGHGGHLGCLRTWWDNPVISEGGCATIGCLHDCVSGTRRDEMLRKLAEGKKTGVTTDEWTIGESKAVEKARKDLMRGGDTPGGRRGQASGRGRNGRQAPLITGRRSGSGNSNIAKKVRLLVPQNHEGSDVEIAASVESQNSTSTSAP